MHLPILGETVTLAVIPGDQTKGHRIVPKLTLFGVVSTPCMVSGQESSS